MVTSAFKPESIDDRQKILVKSQEVVRTYSTGDSIFSQGDRGGDLLFIESGSVEIFIIKNGQHIVLATMGPGEIIGVMTFLTRDDRLASAKATAPTKIKQIPSQHVQKYISSFPKWLSIVLKEFIARINQMNRMYSETLIELKKIRELQITPLFLATQMAQSLSIVGKGIAKSQDGNDIVFVEELKEKMQLVLNQPKEMVESLFAVFNDAGLLKAEIEIERKLPIYQLTNLEKASVFTQFVRESSQGSTRKILKAKLLHREMRVIKAMSRYALKKGNPPDKSGSLTEAELVAELKKTTGVEFVSDSLTKPAKLGLLVRKGEGATAAVVFTPSTLMRTLACVQAMRQLTGEDQGEESESVAVTTHGSEDLTEMEELIPTSA